MGEAVSLREIRVSVASQRQVSRGILNNFKRKKIEKLDVKKAKHTVRIDRVSFYVCYVLNFNNL